MFNSKRQKIYIVLPLKRKEKNEYGTYETTYAHIPVVAEITGKNYKYDLDGALTLKYSVLPYAQIIGGKLQYINEENSKKFKEIELTELYIYDNLNQCLDSCIYANSYCKEFLKRDYINKTSTQIKEEMAKLESKQNSLIDSALDFASNICLSEELGK